LDLRELFLHAMPDLVQYDVVRAVRRLMKKRSGDIIFFRTPVKDGAKSFSSGVPWNRA
jgi:hypothetical protein